MIRCVVQRKAGYGNSTVIHKMVQRITDNFGIETVKIAAYTRSAAFKNLKFML